MLGQIVDNYISLDLKKISAPIRIEPTSDASPVRGSAGRFLDTADMTTEELVVLVAALVGAAICIGVLIGAFLFLRVRRKMDPMAARVEENSAGLCLCSLGF